MSPGPAAVLALANGARVFVKAVSESVNAVSHRLYRQEADLLNTLPAGVPAARPVGVAEVGDWLALVLEFAPGQPAGPPWSTAAVHAVARACEVVAACPAPAGFVPVIERLPDLDGWSALAATDQRGLTPWEIRHVEDLAAATAGWRVWTGGEQLTHQDVRCDNAIIDVRGSRAVLVDWGFCSKGAPWLDRAMLAADVVGAGHADGPRIAREQALDLLAGLPAEAARFVLAQAGMWRRNSTLPAHPGMPAHRAWQRSRADALQPLLDDLLHQLRTG
jgi:aminoglycoside phosphotransferase (APT) family kinase protein